MKIKKLITTSLLLVSSQSAFSALLFDQDVTSNAIFGSGNANGGFTVDRNNGIELGLRGKLRFDANNLPQNQFNSNGDGTYSFDAGLPPTGFSWAPGSMSSAVWNFEWSVNSDFSGQDLNVLSTYRYVLGMDFDPGVGENLFTFDPVNVACSDNAIGDNSTASGDGTSVLIGACRSTDLTVADAASADYKGLIDNNNLAQNSWNMEFFDDAPNGFAFDARIDGQYDFYLAAFDDNGTQLARTEISIIVGDGATEVSEPATLALFGLGLGCLAVRRRKQVNRQRWTMKKGEGFRSTHLFNYSHEIISEDAEENIKQ